MVNENILLWLLKTYLDDQDFVMYIVFTIKVIGLYCLFTERGLFLLSFAQVIIKLPNRNS